MIIYHYNVRGKFYLEREFLEVTIGQLGIINLEGNEFRLTTQIIYLIYIGSNNLAESFLGTSLEKFKIQFMKFRR